MEGRFSFWKCGVWMAHLFERIRQLWLWGGGRRKHKRWIKAPKSELPFDDCYDHPSLKRIGSKLRSECQPFFAIEDNKKSSLRVSKVTEKFKQLLIRAWMRPEKSLSASQEVSRAAYLILSHWRAFAHSSDQFWWIQEQTYQVDDERGCERWRKGNCCNFLGSQGGM